MNKKKIVKQHDEKDCGAACFIMILNYYGKWCSMNNARHVIGTDSNGTSMYGLIKGAESFGFDAEGLEGNINELIDYYFEHDKNPFIAHLLINNQIEHYIVVYEISKKNMLIGDPAYDKPLKIKIDEFLEMWTGKIISFNKRNEISVESDKPQYDIKSVVCLKPYRKKIIYAIFSTIIISIISLLSTYFLESIIDYFTNDNQNNKTEFLIKDMIIIFVAICMAYFLRTILEIFRTILTTKMVNHINGEINGKAIENILNMPYAWYEQYKTGDIMTRMEDITIIGNTVVEIIISLSMNLTLIFVCGIVLFNKNKSFFILTLCFTGIYLLIIKLINRPMKRVNYKLLKHSSQYNAHLKECVDGYELIKTHCLEKKVEKISKDNYNHLLSENYKFNLVSSFEQSVLSLLMSIFNIIVLFYGMVLVYNNSITLGGFVLVYVLTIYFQTPLLNLAEIHPKWQEMSNEIDRLRDILDEKIDCKDDVELSTINLKNDIVFDNVSFSYGVRNQTLSNVNIKILSGEKIAIIGKSGSGKTTLAKLLMKLYDDFDGTIKVGDISILTYPTEAFRQKIAYISQKFEFLMGTLRFNLVFEQELSDEKIKMVLQSCFCNEFIDRLPYGLDTVIDCQGSMFSTGEKQRLVLARELLKNPDIIIFDEVTSNLDKASANYIKNTISTIGAEITCLIITHTEELLEICDKVYSLDAGEYVN